MVVHHQAPSLQAKSLSCPQKSLLLLILVEDNCLHLSGPVSMTSYCILFSSQSKKLKIKKQVSQLTKLSHYLRFFSWFHLWNRRKNKVKTLKMLNKKPINTIERSQTVVDFLKRPNNTLQSISILVHVFFILFLLPYLIFFSISQHRPHLKRTKKQVEKAKSFFHLF